MNSSADLHDRTKSFANRVIRLYAALPNTTLAQVIGRQLLRSGTLVGANYRAACRARSRAEFFSKISVVLEEADETVYWLELLEDNRIIAGNRLMDLLRESRELTAIFTATKSTLRSS